MASSLSTFLGGLAVVGVLALTSSASYAQDNDDDLVGDLPFVCDLESVAGVYGFNFEHFPLPRDRGFIGAPIATIGLLDLRPDGSFIALLDSTTEVAEGEVIEEEIRGTWDVRPNCIGRFDATEGRSFDGVEGDVDGGFVAVENASELLMHIGFASSEIDAKLVFRR